VTRFSIVSAGVFLTSAIVALVTFSPIVDLEIDLVLSDLGTIRQAVAVLKQRGSPLPPESIGLEALTKSPAILERVPTDQWGQAYVYRLVANSQGYVVYSIGRNGVDEQGKGDDVTDSSKSYTCRDYDVGCGTSARELVFIVSCTIALLSLLASLYAGAVNVVHRARRKNAA
jgi:hypothetical protein